jgi:hypothetical protein
MINTGIHLISVFQALYHDHDGVILFCIFIRIEAVFARSDDKQRKIDIVKQAFTEASIDHVSVSLLSDADIAEFQFPLGIKLTIKSAIQALRL